MDDARLGNRACDPWHRAMGTDARSGIDHRRHHPRKPARTFPTFLPVSAGNRSRRPHRNDRWACFNSLDSLLHAALVDMVRSRRSRNHICSWCAGKPGYQLFTCHFGITMSDGKRHELIRGLGPWTSAAIVVGSMIGTGIFLKPSEMAADAGSVSIVFAAWIAGAILSLFGALAFAELGAALPEAGGEYAYLRRGLGPKWGFLFGWMYSIVGLPAGMSALAAGLLRFCGFLFPAVAQPIFTLPILLPSSSSPYLFSFTWAQPLAVLAVVALTFVNYLGVRVGGRIQVILTTIKVASVAAIIILAFSLARPGGVGFHPFLPASYGGATLTGFFGALAASLWVYDGWEHLGRVGSEVKDPQRNIPYALIAGVAFCAVVFILFSAASHW